MRLEYQVLAAVLADLILGDPRWLPHPVRGIGWLAARLETLARRCIRNERAAGVLAALTVYVSVGGAAWGALWLAGRAHPIAADVVAIVLIYTAFAARDLSKHSMVVFLALATGNLAQARKSVGRIVGRDTDRLDQPGVVRAAVESVAESTVDGVTAPLFYALVAGPIGAVVYRAINTLDSMFGHQDARYARFGWAAARIDDLANYVPARLTAPLVCLAAFILRKQPLQALRILIRDGRKHSSPNAGLTEAAMAGALGVQLGGLNYYDGKPSPKPMIGDPDVPLIPRHILSANGLMLMTGLLFLVFGVAIRIGALYFWEATRAAS